MASGSRLALLGGEKSVQYQSDDIFAWPIITSEDEDAVLEVLRRGGMSGLEVTMQFEKEFAEWQGSEYSLAFNTGTGAIEAAMFGCNIGVGDEIICPSVTYWASAAPCFTLGATVAFADISPETLCIDPDDIEHRITDRTKAIVVVHYLGYPADMDPIMEIAGRYNLKVIEDVSHAHGGIYKGRKLGSIGDVAAYSLMSGKPLAAGEGGMLVTSNLEIYERAIAWGHYERFNTNIKTPDLQPYIGLPLGGHKYRMHQLTSAVGRVQLRHYDARMDQIKKAMNYFWDCLQDVPGLRAHRPAKDSGSQMGGWYAAHGLYVQEELNGLSVSRFVEAVRSEGYTECVAGCNLPLHLHRVFQTCDVYGHGKPTRIAHTDRDLRETASSLPVSESICNMTYWVPWFKHFKSDVIDQYVDAYRKVVENHKDILDGDEGNPPHVGGWNFFKHK